MNLPTSHALTRTTPADLTAPGTPAAALVAAWLSGRSERTRRAYAADLADFCSFLNVPDTDAAAALLFSLPHGAANATALGYRSHLLERELAPATVNRRLAALRSLVKLGRVLGVVSWTLEVENLEAKSYRDTRGPSVDEFLEVLDAIGTREPKDIRDRALLWLLYNPALRRGEVVALDVAHVERTRDGRPAALRVLGKGRRQRERIELSELPAAALAEWLEARGPADGPLFLSFDPTGAGDGRLTGAGVYAIVQARGRAAGLDALRPHGLRHGGITAYLDASGGNLRAGQSFSRHARSDTLALYDDNRRNLARGAADTLDAYLLRRRSERAAA